MPSRLDLNNSVENSVKAPDAEKERKAIIRNRIADCIFLVSAVLMTGLAIYEFIFVGAGASKVLFAAIWTVILITGITKGRKKFFLLFIVFNLFLGAVNLCLWLFPYGFTSEAQWRYKSQVKYVDDPKSCFPDELPRDISDYRIEYQPSFWQDAGHFRVHFKTSLQQLEQYEKEYSSQAIYTIPLSDFKGMWDTQVKEISPKAGVSHGDDKSLMVAFDQDYWEEHERDATVYVLHAVHNWNHPHSRAVIINKTEKMVEFTHLG